MASLNSPIRNLVKPFLFKLLGTKGYKYFQYLGKLKDIKNRLIDEPEMELLPSFISSADEVLDIGANYAYYTERMARLCKQGKVYAFEPIPFTYDVAARIVRKLALNNVEIYQKGVGANTEILRFSVPKLSFGSISAGQAHIKGRDNEMVKGSDYYVSDQTEEFDCEVVDIDHFLLPRLQSLSFVKIDIEGAEHFALKGMAQTLARFKPVILIEIVPLFLKSFAITVSEFQALIESELGYRIYQYDPVSKKLNAVSGALEKDMNYVLIHHEKTGNYSSLIQ